MNHSMNKNRDPVSRLSQVDVSRLPADGGPHYNRLIFEKSPYLLQHAENPLAWYPWGEEAFARARAEDKPVFLSIGYSTCHWCHVMAHECFEDPEVADVLNRQFISIKVDREERPDIDNTYMTACQVVTGSGGWPLTLVLTPEKKPFFAATYLPKSSRGGMIGLIDLAQKISEMWSSERERLTQSADQIVQTLQRIGQSGTQGVAPDERLLQAARESFIGTYDRRFAGFGSAPKFPMPTNLSLLLHLARRNDDEQARVMALQTLQQIRMGGIFDQVGFGLHRYSVDQHWLVPHFEKMLYDQALVALAFLDGWQVSGDPFFAQATREVFSYVIRDLKHGEGGFYCGEDADSEGEEGTFYLWTEGEIKEVLGEHEGDIFCQVFGVSAEGNFEGKNILHMSRDVQEVAAGAGVAPDDLSSMLGQCRHQLFQARENRPRPHLDDKILTGWNGLMIAALARGGAILEEGVYLAEAAQAVDFILQRLRDGSGRLLRRYRDEEAAIAAFLEDYSFFVFGLSELYLATFEVRFLGAALELNQAMLNLFDDGEGGLFDTGADAETVLTRGRSVHDGAVPAGSSIAALNLLRLGRLSGDPALEEKGERLLSLLLAQAEKNPQAFSQLLIALDYALGPRDELVIALPAGHPWPTEMLDVVRADFRPNLLVVLSRPEDSALGLVTSLGYDKEPSDGKATAYLCRDRACREPVTSKEDLERLLAP